MSTPPDERWTTFARLYGERLRGRSVLDVGAGPQHLRRALGEDVTYVALDRPGSQADVTVDLEHEPLPFADDAFDAVVCMDVLEHLDDPHAVIDELFRVGRTSVIVALPNAWRAVYQSACRGDYRDGQAVKYYGLLADPPDNRHKWFLNAAEAERFLRTRAERSGWEVVDLRQVARPGRSRLKHPVRSVAEWCLFRRGIGVEAFYGGQTWALFAPATTPR